jgi:hypothetical protein
MGHNRQANLEFKHFHIAPRTFAEALKVTNNRINLDCFQAPSGVRQIFITGIEHIGILQCDELTSLTRPSSKDHCKRLSRLK